MRRREFIVLLGGAAAAWPLAVRAQRSMPVIGVLVVGIRGSEKFWRLFQEDLSKRGYVEGKTVRFEFRSDQGKVRPTSRTGERFGADQARCDRDVVYAGSNRRRTSDARDSNRHGSRRRPHSHRPRQESLPAGGKRDWDVRRGCGAFQQAC